MLTQLTASDIVTCASPICAAQSLYVKTQAPIGLPPRKMTLSGGLAIALLTMSGAVQAQQSNSGLFTRESRFFKSELKEQRRVSRAAVIAPTDEAPKPAVDLTLGLSYTDLQGGGHVANTPFDLTYVDGQEKLIGRISGDGYVRSTVGGSTVDGFGDVQLAASYPIAGVPGLRLGAGLKIGMGGGVGSSSEAFNLSASYKRPLGKAWIAGASAKWAHDLGSPLAGASRNVASGGLQIARLLDQSVLTDIFAQVGRAYRINVGGSSFATIGADLTLGKGWSATVSLGVGLTKGSRDKSFGLDFTRSL